MQQPFECSLNVALLKILFMNAAYDIRFKKAEYTLFLLCALFIE